MKTETIEQITKFAASSDGVKVHICNGCGTSEPCVVITDSDEGRPSHCCFGLTLPDCRWDQVD